MSINAAEIVLQMLGYRLSTNEFAEISRIYTTEEWEQMFNTITLRQEHQTGAYDIHGRFDESKISWETDKPWINTKINKAFEQTGIPNKTVFKSNYSIHITHDIDWTTTLEYTSILKSILSSNWVKASKCIDRKLLSKNFEKTLQHEQKNGVTSWNFFLADNYGFDRYSTRYKITWAESRRHLELAKQYQANIGLHGSYYAKDKDSYQSEKNLLSQTAAKEINAHRNHYLRFDTQKGYNQLQTAGFKYDYSVGYVNKIGFRAGVATPYYGYDFVTNRVTDIVEIPLLLMERSDYTKNVKETYSFIKQRMELIKEVNGTMAVLSHPDLFEVDTFWWDFYTTTIQLAKETGADVSGKIKEEN